MDFFTVDKNRVVSFDDRADSEEVEILVEALLEKGFKPEHRPENIHKADRVEKPTEVGDTGETTSVGNVNCDEGAADSLTISYPRTDITNAALENRRWQVAEDKRKAAKKDK